MNPVVCAAAARVNRPLPKRQEIEHRVVERASVRILEKPVREPRLLSLLQSLV
jgi:hypothetical protein